MAQIQVLSTALLRIALSGFSSLLNVSESEFSVRDGEKSDL